jgi:hypothetical protein
LETATLRPFLRLPAPFLITLATHGVDLGFQLITIANHGVDLGFQPSNLRVLLIHLSAESRAETVNNVLDEQRPFQDGTASTIGRTLGHEVLLNERFERHNVVNIVDGRGVGGSGGHL